MWKVDNKPVEIKVHDGISGSMTKYLVLCRDFEHCGNYSIRNTRHKAYCRACSEEVKEKQRIKKSAYVKKYTSQSVRKRANQKRALRRAYGVDGNMIAWRKELVEDLNLYNSGVIRDEKTRKSIEERLDFLRNLDAIGKNN